MATFFSTVYSLSLPNFASVSTVEKNKMLPAHSSSTMNIRLFDIAVSCHTSLWFLWKFVVIFIFLDFKRSKITDTYGVLFFWSLVFPLWEPYIYDLSPWWWLWHWRAFWCDADSFQKHARNEQKPSIYDDEYTIRHGIWTRITIANTTNFKSIKLQFLHGALHYALACRI